MMYDNRMLFTLIQLIGDPDAVCTKINALAEKKLGEVRTALAQHATTEAKLAKREKVLEEERAGLQKLQTELHEEGADLQRREDALKTDKFNHETLKAQTEKSWQEQGDALNKDRQSFRKEMAAAQQALEVQQRELVKREQAIATREMGLGEAEKRMVQLRKTLADAYERQS